MIFRNWVLQNFPFLEDDFDALTDYELFCKMVEYMKKSLEKVTGFQKEIDAFTIKLDEFQHWFDTLDVQEEINNKLDEMAESGELTDIIAQYLQLAGVLAYVNLNQMKSAENLANGSIAVTLGDTYLNDGRGSNWYIRTKTTDDVESAELIFLQNNLVAVKINNFCGTTTGQLYGIRNTACITNINNTNNPAEVMGFTNESELATYVNRDHVIQYKEYRGVEPNVYTIDSVTVNSVTLTTLPTNVKIGSIVDLYEDNTFNKNDKYSGFVNDIDDDTIYVNNWYKTGDTSLGQLPADVTLACIDMPTKVWVNNDNLILNDDTNVKEGVIGEYGLISESGKDASGLDVVNIQGANTFGYMARSSTSDLTSDDLLDCGYIAWNTNNGLLARNNNYPLLIQDSSNQNKAYIGSEGEYYNYNQGTNPIISMTNKIFEMNPNGTIQRMSFNVAQRNDGGTINTEEMPTYIDLTGSNTYTLDNGAIGRLLIINARAALNNLVINGNTYGLQQGKTVILVNIGGNYWVDILGTLF